MNREVIEATITCSKTAPIPKWLWCRLQRRGNTDYHRKRREKGCIHVRSRPKVVVCRTPMPVIEICVKSGIPLNNRRHPTLSEHIRFFSGIAHLHRHLCLRWRYPTLRRNLASFTLPALPAPVTWNRTYAGIPALRFWTRAVLPRRCYLQGKKCVLGYQSYKCLQYV